MRSYIFRSDLSVYMSCRRVGGRRVHGIAQRAGFVALPRTIDDIMAILDQEKPDPAKRAKPKLMQTPPTGSGYNGARNCRCRRRWSAHRGQGSWRDRLDGPVSVQYHRRCRRRSRRSFRPRSGFCMPTPGRFLLRTDGSACARTGRYLSTAGG